MQFLQRSEVCGNILANGGVGTPAGFDGADSGRGEGAVAGKEFGVFAGEDVVCYGAEGVRGAEGVAQGQHEGGLAGADGSGRGAG